MKLWSQSLIMKPFPISQFRFFVDFKKIKLKQNKGTISNPTHSSSLLQPPLTHTHTHPISSLQQHCRQRMALQLVIKAGYWSQDAEGRLHLLYHTAASPVSWLWLLLQVVILPDFTVIYLCQTGAAHSCELGESLLPALPPLCCRISR